MRQCIVVYNGCVTEVRSDNNVSVDAVDTVVVDLDVLNVDDELDITRLGIIDLWTFMETLEDADFRGIKMESGEVYEITYEGVKIDVVVSRALYPIKLWP